MSAAPLRVAVIGAGPAGFFATEELLRAPGRTVMVDLFERLPTPYGLVRGGVAPDHQKIKEVIRRYEKTAALPGFRFFGNVTFGVDLHLPEMLAHYHQVLITTGAEGDRRLGIPGEDLPGSHSATEFVAWYNGHPDYHEAQFNLDTERVAVVGNGNVAVDVARILTRSIEELERTDIAEYALEALSRSQVREVYLLGRRGPTQAAFTPPELGELMHLTGVDFVTLDRDLQQDAETRSRLTRQTIDPTHQRIVELLTAQRANGEGRQRRKICARFFVSPVAVLGTNRVEGLRLERNELVEDANGNVNARGTGVYEDIACGLVFRSIGYKGHPIPGVPFDERKGIIPHRNGRVLDPDTNAPLPRVYVAGWIKRGPSGVIGTNKADASETVQAMLADAEATGSLHLPDRDVIPLLARKGVRVVSFDAWQRINDIEVAAGKRRGKPREKLTTVADLLAAADEQRTPVGPRNI
jgi:ferredoxin--NADP+ reductase